MDFIDSLSAEIAAAHTKHSGKEIVRPDYLPDKGEVAEVTELLRRLLFPGYFDDNSGDEAERRRAVRGLLAEVDGRLRRLVCCAMNLDTVKPEDCSEKYGKADGVCHEFMGRIPALIELLFADVQATFDGDPAADSKHEIIFAYPGIFAVSVHRLAHELHLLSVPLIPRMMAEYAHSLTGIDIHPGAKIGHHLCIDHGTGIVIGETAEIGAYVKLYQGVTLGALSTKGGHDLSGEKRHPTIEDEVTIYSGASILGGETVIGRGSVIGGNVFITKSVPPNTRVNIKKHDLDYGMAKAPGR